MDKPIVMLHTAYAPKESGCPLLLISNDESVRLKNRKYDILKESGCPHLKEIK